jgi:hypothetical protein
MKYRENRNTAENPNRSALKSAKLLPRKAGTDLRAVRENEQRMIDDAAPFLPHIEAPIVIPFP